MLDELKNAYKIVGYGLRIKTQLGLAALFAGLGILFEILSGGELSTGSFYIVLSGMFIYQLIISTDVSTLVQSSPYKKKIQCTYPILATAPWLYLTLTILSIVHAIFARESEEKYLTMCRLTVLLGCLLFVLMFYFGLAYKFFVGATVFMVISVFPPIIIFDNENRLSAMCTNLGVCTLIAYLLMTLGVVCCWLVTRLTYKKELSKIAFKAALRTK